MLPRHHHMQKHASNWNCQLDCLRPNASYASLNSRFVNRTTTEFLRKYSQVTGRAEQVGVVAPDSSEPERGGKINTIEVLFEVARGRSKPFVISDACSYKNNTNTHSFACVLPHSVLEGPLVLNKARLSTFMGLMHSLDGAPAFLHSAGGTLLVWQGCPSNPGSTPWWVARDSCGAINPYYCCCTNVSCSN